MLRNSCTEPYLLVSQQVKGYKGRLFKVASAETKKSGGILEFPPYHIYILNILFLRNTKQYITVYDEEH